MARNRDHLEGLLEIIKQITIEEENSWFKNNLAESISINLPKSGSRIDDSKIDDIHEHFFRKIILKQAGDFYSTILYKDQKEQLIADFVKMEYARRNNDFENFCLAMYQQVELIVNHIYESEKIYQRVNVEKNIVINGSGGSRLCNFLAKSSNQEHVDELYNIRSVKWSLYRKLRAVVFFKYSEIETGYFQLHLLERICTIAGYLSLGRNQVHRGAVIYEHQEMKIEEIKRNPQEFYLRFLGFLEEFVSLVCKSSFFSI